MTIIGYARTSTSDQQAGLADQVAALEQAGCERIWQEHVSALARDRPELKAALTWCREGDTFVVTKPDRLARSVPDMLSLDCTPLMRRFYRGIESIRYPSSRTQMG